LEIKQIFKLDSARRGYKPTESNRFLLFHGSQISNFMGILAQGLQIQPLGAVQAGARLGKGLYFTDALTKAVDYCVDKNAPRYASKFVLICEVSLGSICESAGLAANVDKAPEGYDSVMALGRVRPEDKKTCTLPDGAMLPLGKLRNDPKTAHSNFQFDEYVVYSPEQVRVRYVVQLK